MDRNLLRKILIYWEEGCASSDLGGNLLIHAVGQ